MSKIGGLDESVILWLPASAGRMWLPLNLLRFEATHASFRLKPEATKPSGPAVRNFDDIARAACT